jgi:stage II sporulation protein GA (sporulation sigma-E factor processing peptidase)
MYVYADVIFIINIIMNSTILLLTAWTAGINYKLWRIILAGAVGSCYVLAGLLPGMMMIYQPLCKAMISLLLILVAFGFKSIRSTFLLVAFFYVVAFILGGAVAGWLYFWQTSNYLGSSTMVITNLSWIHLLFGSCTGIALIIIVLRRILPRLTRQQHLHQVKIEYEGRKIELTGMLDTGNGLYTVIGRRPVIVVNQCAVESILSAEVVDFLRKNSPEMWLTNLDQCMDLTWISRIQIIPYHAIGSKSMLLSFRPDHFMVASEAGFIEIRDVVIGIYSGNLAADGEYAVLLHSQIMNELSKIEGASVCA